MELHRRAHETECLGRRQGLGTGTTDGPGEAEPSADPGEDTAANAEAATERRF